MCVSFIKKKLKLQSINLIKFMVEKKKVSKTSLEWQKILEPEQYMIMREEATEMPHSSELNKEKREGFRGFHLPQPT